jgi:hypothetical protein
MNVYPSRRRNKKPKAAPLPRDKLEKTKEAAYFEKNFLAANKKKSEIDRKVGYLRNKISALRHADHQRSVVRRIFGTLSKDPQEETDMLLAELRALQEKRFRFDGRELDIHSLVRHCDREAGRWAGRLIDIERELKARVALDAREARELVARERKTKKEAKQKEQAALAAARL